MFLPYLPSSLRQGLAGLIAAGLAVVPAACNPLKPGNPFKRDTSNVSVAFDPTALGDLADAMKTLQVRAFRVENDETGAPEGDAQRFAIEPQRQEYTIKNVTLGLKDIEVAILDDQDLALGTGTVRVLVKPGKNRTDTLKIKLTRVVQPVTSVPVELKVGGNGAALVEEVSFWWRSAASGSEGTLALTPAPSPGTDAVTYAEIKPILQENCIVCHKEGNAKGKLKVDRFPFVSGNIPDQTQLMTTVMERLQNADDPMPQDGLLDQALIDRFKAWQTGGFLAVAPAAGELLFKGTLGDQRVADLLACKVTLRGVEGVELMAKDLASYLVQESGLLSVAVDLTVEDPSVEIPIVVEP